MKQNPERLAWMILLAAFVTFCMVAVSCPLTVRSYLRNARQSLHVQINSQRGTVRVEQGGSTRIDATSQDDPSPLKLFNGDSVRTGKLDEGLLTLQRDSDGSRETLVTVVVYDNSDIVLVNAYSPRFGLSAGSHKAVFKVKGGRIRIEVRSAGDERPVQVEVRTDHARIYLSKGSYALEVTNQQTTATVRSGQASVHVGDQELALSDEQRAVVSLEGQLDGPLPAERNLIVNGDFGQGIDAGWTIIADDSTRVVSANDDEGQPIAWFQHDQPQPSQVSLIQTLNRNVKDLESLVLHLKVRVDSQSLSVCGSKGSECPVMLRIDYIDAGGGDRQWVHGFYAFEDPAQPYYCLTCPAPSSGNHSRVTEKAWFLYDSPNLMEIMPIELRPATVQSVRVYASGHSFESMVTDVELLAQE